MCAGSVIEKLQIEHESVWLLLGKALRGRVHAYVGGGI